MGGSEEGIEFAGVSKHSYELPSLVVGTKLKSSVETTSIINCWTISLVLEAPFLRVEHLVTFSILSSISLDTGIVIVV